MKGAAGSGVVAQDELVRLPDLDVKVFDTCDMLEAYLQTYSKTYISCECWLTETVAQSYTV
ncbi:hypothetical protein PF008_g9300 [Phytophthora fragariae]|uniref:Uncharacterized protein n=1 Tax=Phytophthora fragariae TaxID=53985 RepID=A0A6G0RX82_9STRA|nr:hypothetical protein PF008_g9300 [Phytophthora fragariae]